MRNNEECAMAWNPRAYYPGEGITKDMICTLAKDHGGWETACMGDSGGRLCFHELGLKGDHFLLVCGLYITFPNCP